MEQKENVQNELLENEFFSLSEKSKVFFKAKLFGRLATNQIIPSWLGHLYLRCTI